MKLCCALDRELKGCTKKPSGKNYGVYSFFDLMAFSESAFNLELNLVTW